MHSRVGGWLDSDDGFPVPEPPPASDTRLQPAASVDRTLVDGVIAVHHFQLTCIGDQNQVTTGAQIAQA